MYPWICAANDQRKVFRGWRRLFALIGCMVLVAEILHFISARLDASALEVKLATARLAEADNVMALIG